MTKMDLYQLITKWEQGLGSTVYSSNWNYSYKSWCSLNGILFGHSSQPTPNQLLLDITQGANLWPITTLNSWPNDTLLPSGKQPECPQSTLFYDGNSYIKWNKPEIYISNLEV